MRAEQPLEPSDWQHVQTLWVGALCSVDEVVQRTTGEPAVLKHMHAEHRQEQQRPDHLRKSWHLDFNIG